MPNSVMFYNETAKSPMLSASKYQTCDCSWIQMILPFNTSAISWLRHFMLDILKAPYTTVIQLNSVKWSTHYSGCYMIDTIVFVLCLASDCGCYMIDTIVVVLCLASYSSCYMIDPYRWLYDWHNIAIVIWSTRYSKCYMIDTL